MDNRIQISKGFNLSEVSIKADDSFMGLFDHNGLKRSSGVRPIKDNIREAAPIRPDTDNFSNNVNEFGESEGLSGDESGDFFGEGLGEEENNFSDVIEVSPSSLGQDVPDIKVPEFGIRIKKENKESGMKRKIKKAQVGDKMQVDVNDFSELLSFLGEELDRRKMHNRNVPPVLVRIYEKYSDFSFGEKDFEEEEVSNSQPMAKAFKWTKVSKVEGSQTTAKTSKWMKVSQMESKDYDMEVLEEGCYNAGDIEECIGYLKEYLSNHGVTEGLKIFIKDLARKHQINPTLIVKQLM
ncbi:hypothetical protein M0P65_05450 [Candidatus Gracilibacteria bacterium]|nr:hypothetical protein [Candidatus Gracilibacteria bacterium]